MNANFSILRIVEIILEQTDSENRHTSISDEQTTVVVLPRVKFNSKNMSHQSHTAFESRIDSEVHALLCPTSSFIRKASLQYPTKILLSS